MQLILAGGCLLLNADPAATGQNQPQDWEGQSPQTAPAAVSSLDGAWQSSTGTALVIQGQQYQMYQNGQPAVQFNLRMLEYGPSLWLGKV